jgi:hypothetical protein
VYAIVKRHDLKIACLGKIAYRMGFIDEASGLLTSAEELSTLSMANYLEWIFDKKVRYRAAASADPRRMSRL